MKILTRALAPALAVALATLALTHSPATAATSKTGSLTATAVSIFSDGTELTNTTLPAEGSDLTEATTATVTLNGKTIWRTTFTKTNFTSIPVPKKDMQAWPAGRAILTVKSGNLTATARVHIHRGWAPLPLDSDDRYLLASYPRCQALTWWYDATNAPAGVKRVAEDLRVVFRTYSKYTGLPLSQATGNEADIVISWENLGERADGIGGSRYTGTTYLDGLVKLNTQSTWAKTPGFTEKGRGALLYHEVGHVFGLGHVEVPKTLMSPTNIIGYTNPAPGAFEIRGLNFLYAPSTCTKR